MSFKRVHVIVLDSVGIGQAPDAKLFNDEGADTLGNIAKYTNLNIPYLERLGIGAIRDLQEIDKNKHQIGYVTRLEEVSVGKDTMTGHWELMGLKTEKPFKVYPEGFPEELIKKIEDFSGRKVVCNKPYSGTKVLDDYGKHQMETGDLIIYTSADPVLQIAAHEEIIPLEELYKICKYVRSITDKEPYLVGRIIARPYLGTEENFVRTSNRHDYALNPHGKTALDMLKEAGKDVIAIGKINDIFNGQGITEFVYTKSNMDGVDKLVTVLKQDFEGLSFTNLVDFDASYGHRRDVEGYAKALAEFDARIPEIIENMHDDDLLIITADHGNDPTYKGTDHTREYVPLLAYSKQFKQKGVLPIGKFADISATIIDNFKVKSMENGKSFLGLLE